MPVRMWGIPSPMYFGASFHKPHGLVCSYTFPVTMETIAPAVPEKVKYVGKILGATFSGNESEAESGAKTATAYRSFRDVLYNGKRVAFPITGEKLPRFAEAVVNEAFAPLPPVKVDVVLTTKMLRKIC